MRLSYFDLFSGTSERQEFEASVTTDHPCSSYGQPVIVLPDGGALDVTSWIVMDYHIEKCTYDELKLLRKLFDFAG